jgi:hypothetical protein
MNTLDKTQRHGAFAFVSMMLFAAALYSAPLLRAESIPSSTTQSFIGTVPAADTVEPLPPTF